MDHIHKTMTARQVQLVQQTWRIVRDIDPALVGEVFYARLLMLSPSMKQYFRGRKGMQTRKLMDMIGMVVARLDRGPHPLPELLATGRWYHAKGLRARHYAQAGEALRWTLKQALGHEWTADLEEAWTMCCNHIAHLMLHAGEPTQGNSELVT